MKIPEMIATYVGEPAPFFFAVARNVAHEARRRKEIATDELPENADLIREITDDKYECLLGCLRLLTADKQELIEDYYLYDGKDKIVHHRQMAKDRGITDGALRTRAHSIRVNLEKCVTKCMKRLNQKQKPIWEALLKRRGVTTPTSKERQP